MGARIALNAFATADGGDCTETLGRWNRAGGFAFGQSPKRAAIIPHRHRHEKITCNQARKLTADKWALSETEPGCRDAEGETKRA